MLTPSSHKLFFSCYKLQDCISSIHLFDKIENPSINIRGESHENLKLLVASGAAIFTLLPRRRVALLHRTATCRPLFKPWVSLLSTCRQSRCVSKFYRTF